MQRRVPVLKYAATHGIRPAAARFGLDGKTARAGAGLKEAGTVGLVPRYPKRDAAASRNPWLSSSRTQGGSSAGERAGFACGCWVYITSKWRQGPSHVFATTSVYRGRNVRNADARRGNITFFERQRAMSPSRSTSSS